MANLGQLRTEVLSRLGLPTDDGMADATALNSAINAALAEYAVEADWPWLQSETTFTTVAGTATTSLPAGFVRTLYVRIGDEEVQYRAYRDVIQYANDSDQPRFYTGSVGQIKWVPTPNAAYSVVFGYIQQEPVLTADGNTPLLPAFYHDYIVVKAARKMAERLRDGPLLEMLRVSEAEWLAKLRADARRTASLGRVRTFYRGV